MRLQRMRIAFALRFDILKKHDTGTHYNHLRPHSLHGSLSFTKQYDTAKKTFKIPVKLFF